MPSNPPAPKDTCCHCGATGRLMVCGWNADSSERRRCRDEAACIARWLPECHPALAQRQLAAGQPVRVQSYSNATQYYTVTANGCDCPDATFRGRVCKHARRLLAAPAAEVA